MLSAEELLSKPEFAEYIQTHQSRAEAIRRAAQQLAGASDAEKALRKLLPAISANVINVFFSYKSKDEQTASEVVQILRKLSAGKLDITYQAEFTKETTGKKWRRKIRRSIKGANWFILLLPDPSDDWDWCLFETGLFEANHTSADRLICIHHPDIKIPNPIEGYHAVDATVPDVEKFLSMVLIENNPLPGMDALNQAFENEIPTYSQKIVDAIRPPIKDWVMEVFEPSIEIRLTDAGDLKSKEELDRAQVASANPAALKLFGFIKKPALWGELRRYIVEADNDGRWREELFHVIRRIATGRDFYPIQAVFRIYKGKIYRPVAHAIRRMGENGPIDTYNIIFTEDVGALDHSAMPQDVSVLASLLRVAFRFRWEVLETYTTRAMQDIDVDRLDISLQRISIEADSRGISDQDTVVHLFPEGQRQVLSDMFSEWYKARNDTETGSLDVAIKNRNISDIQSILRVFLPINQHFLEIAADRFSTMINQAGI